MEKKYIIGIILCIFFTIGIIVTVILLINNKSSNKNESIPSTTPNNASTTPNNASTTPNTASTAAYNTASTTAYNTASTTAYNTASTTAYNDASTKAYNDASTTAYNTASTTANTDASTTAYNNASTAANNASTTAYNNASTTAYNNASTTAYKNASTNLYTTASLNAYNIASSLAFNIILSSYPYAIRISSPDYIELSQIVFKNASGTKINYNKNSIKATNPLNTSVIDYIYDNNLVSRSFPNVYHSGTNNATVDIGLNVLPSTIDIYNCTDNPNRLSKCKLTLYGNNIELHNIQLTAALTQYFSVSSKGIITPVENNSALSLLANAVITQDTYPFAIGIYSTDYIQLSQIIIKNKNGLKINYDKSTMKYTESINSTSIIDLIYDNNTNDRSLPNVYSSKTTNAYINIGLKEAPGSVIIYNSVGNPITLSNCVMKLYALGVELSNIKLKSDKIQKYNIDQNGIITFVEPVIIPTVDQYIIKFIRASPFPIPLSISQVMFFNESANLIDYNRSNITFEGPEPFNINYIYDGERNPREGQFCYNGGPFNISLSSLPVMIAIINSLDNSFGLSQHKLCIYKNNVELDCLQMTSELMQRYMVNPDTQKFER